MTSEQPNKQGRPTDIADKARLAIERMLAIS